MHLNFDHCKIWNRSFLLSFILPTKATSENKLENKKQLNKNEDDNCRFPLLQEWQETRKLLRLSIPWQSRGIK